MIARFSGGIFGTLAFSLSTLTGLIVGNAPEVVLVRSLSALVIFCILGLLLGAAAQAVVDEFVARKVDEVMPEQVATGAEATPIDGKPVGAK